MIDCWCLDVRSEGRRARTCPNTRRGLTFRVYPIDQIGRLTCAITTAAHPSNSQLLDRRARARVVKALARRSENNVCAGVFFCMCFLEHIKYLFDTQRGSITARSLRLWRNTCVSATAEALGALEQITISWCMRRFAYAKIINIIPSAVASDGAKQNTSPSPPG